MNDVDDAAFAFPRYEVNMYGTATVTGGMLLRDYFAANAIQEMAWADDGHNDSRARRCYEIADAMLRARETV